MLPSFLRDILDELNFAEKSSQPNKHFNDISNQIIFDMPSVAGTKTSLKKAPATKPKQQGLRVSNNYLQACYETRSTKDAFITRQITNHSEAFKIEITKVIFGLS